MNTGDTTVTKNDDIRDFNNLDVLGTEGSRKQFIILVEKGREGWNCRSLLGIALFRSPKSKIFVLQATMRCLRKLTDEQLKATVFLSKENLDTLDEELRNNYNMEIKDLGQSSDKKKNSYKVRVLPPPRSIKMKRIWHEYSLIEKEYSEPIDFKVSEIDDAKYESRMYEKGSIRLELSTKETVIDDIKDQMRYSRFSLVGEISRYMNLSCVLISRILSEAIDGFDNLVEAVNKHNEVLDDVIIPKIFNTLYEVKSEQKNEDVDVILLKEPKGSGYYEFSADENLVIEKDHNSFTPEEIKKSFHADTYCFDSKPEKECFLQYTIKGWVMDDERLKRGTYLTEKYFDEQLERIREIRASERKFYQKITDLYATAIDYDKNSAMTRRFYATVQNKMHYAVHGHTAAELIVRRADHTKEHMGLTTWADAPEGKIKKSDVTVAKNYLSQDEMKQLNRMVTAYLDFAENMTLRHIPLTMQDWEKRLNSFIEMFDYGILQDAGKVSAEIAKLHAETEFEKYRVIQDRLFMSDFDKYMLELEENTKK